MNFLVSSRKHTLKKELGLGTNVLADSVAQNSAPTPCPASSFKNYNLCSVPSVKPKFRSRSSIAGASGFGSRVKPANSITAANNDLSSTLDSEALPPALTTLRARPSDYEDLYTLTAYGELPLPKFSDTVPPLSKPSTPLSSGARRLFEVAKPPAKRRRYTVATERPSVSLIEENVWPFDGGNGPINGSGPEEARERAPSSAAHGVEKPTSRPLTIRASSLPCGGCPDSESPTETSSTSALSNSKSSSEALYLSSLPSTPSSVLSKRSSTPSVSHGTKVNVRYVPYFPYMILEPAAALSSLSRSSSTPNENDKQNVGVLSRVKYRIVKVSAEDNEDSILKKE